MRDGEAKVKAVHVQGEKTIPHTGHQGQNAIKRDLEGLTQDWEALASRMDDTQENLMHALQALTAYDGSCDQLNKWLRECETTIKDIDLKRTLGDKQGQVEKLKKMQQEVLARQRHFDELQDMVSHMQGADSRLVNYSSQLHSRYEHLKTNLRVSLLFITLSFKRLLI
jgi:prefoldin subunit 5